MIAVQILIGAVVEDGVRITLRHPHELLARPQDAEEVGVLAGWHPDQIPRAVGEVDWPDSSNQQGAMMYVLNIPILMN